MNGLDLIGTAVSNSLRSKTRTALTVIAIFIGAFTLTLTSAVGTGINRYITTTISSIGATDVMTVTHTPTQTASSGPPIYDPNATTVTTGAMGPGPSDDVTALTPTDLTTLKAVPGVASVTPILTVRPDYVVVGSGTKYQATLGSFVSGMKLDLAAGAQPQFDAKDFQVAIPTSYVVPLGFDNAAAAVSNILTLAVTDAHGAQSTVTATIVGVARAGLVGGTSITPNDALLQALHNTQNIGLTTTAATSYASATVRFNPTASTAQVDQLKTDLKKAGFTGSTVNDTLGAFKTVIDGIILVLNGFAIIALLAAGFGIVNTLLMSVQERTREIGLMKAMGMSGGKLFGLFSIEAVFIGFLGSAIGAGIAIITGSLLNGLLSGGLLSGLPGLTLIAFDPMALLAIVGTVMGIAFLAGTIPALRAARQDPISSLRYE